MDKMKFVKKLKQQLRQKPKEYYRVMNEATKVRLDSEQTAHRIKYGYGITKGLVGNKNFQSLTEKNKQLAFKIVDEECNKQDKWKPKDLVTVGRRIEKRLKKEIK